MTQIAKQTTWTNIDNLTAPKLNYEFDNIDNQWNNHDNGTLAWTFLNATNIKFPNVLGVARVYNVKDYGAVGDGATNDQAAIQAAHDAIVTSAVSGTLYFPPGTYKVNTGLTFHVSFVSILGASAKLDFSSLTSGSAVTFTGDSGNIYLGNPYYNADKYIANMTFVGNGSGGSVKGFRFFAAAEPGASHFKIYNCNISQFGTAISIEDNSYLLSFYGTEAWVCGTCVSVPSGTSNSGERLLFSGCTFFNSATGFDLENANADTHITGTSIDGMTSNYVKITAGNVFVNNCHLEGSPSTTARYIYNPSGGGGTVVIHLHNSIVLVKGARSLKVIDVQSTAYLYVVDSYINADTLASVDIIGYSGAGGMTTIRNLLFTGSDNVFTTGSTDYWYGADNLSLIQTNKPVTLTSKLSITPTTNQLVLGATRTVTLTAPTPATTSRTVTFPDLSGDYNVVGDSGTQTIGGAKTFSSVVTLPNGSVTTPALNVGDAATGLYETASNQIAVTLNGVKAVNFQSTGTGDGTTYLPIAFFGGTSGNAGGITKFTQSGVSTSAKTISNASNDVAFQVVYGTDGAGNDFTDLILVTFTAATPTVVTSKTVSGGPAARTYSMSGNNVVQLAMGSGTYSTSVLGFGTNKR